VRHFLTHRVSLFVTLCIALWASASCFAQEQPQAKQSANVEIIRLKHITAHQAQEATSQLLGGAPNWSIPDQRSNSLLISAPAKVIASVRQVIDKLESAGPPLSEDGAMELTIFSLRHIRARQALDLVNSIYSSGVAGPRGAPSGLPSFAVDERSNRLLVRAPAQEVAVIESLLKVLDVDASPQTSGDARLRVIWLVAGFREPAGSLPDDLNEVVGELRKHGINDLSLAAQTVVNMSRKPQSRFSTQGTAPVPHLGYCQVDINGQVLNSEASSLNVAIEIKAQNIVKLAHPSTLGPGHIKNQFLCGLGTELALPPGHAVVLGVTPFESMTSVFVVQLLETPASKKPSADESSTDKPSADKPSAGKPAAEPKGR
jgi:hypothetical protein